MRMCHEITVRKDEEPTFLCLVASETGRAKKEMFMVFLIRSEK